MPEQERHIRITDAPTDYDGFGTFTVEELDGGYRRVSIHPDHLYWQEMRYKSGLHAPWRPDQWEEHGEALIADGKLIQEREARRAERIREKYAAEQRVDGNGIPMHPLESWRDRENL